MPPPVVPFCSEVIIDPVGNGECVVDVPVKLENGASLKIAGNKKLRLVKQVASQ